MSTIYPKDVKGSPEGSTLSSENLKVTHKKNGQSIVLIPQPSDDPEDPLVSQAALTGRSVVEVLENSFRVELAVAEENPDLRLHLSRCFCRPDVAER